MLPSLAVVSLVNLNVLTKSLVSNKEYKTLEKKKIVAGSTFISLLSHREDVASNTKYKIKYRNWPRISRPVAWSCVHSTEQAVVGQLRITVW